MFVEGEKNSVVFWRTCMWEMGQTGSPRTWRKNKISFFLRPDFRQSMETTHGQDKGIINVCGPLPT
jgi:hypothetical protein